MSENDPSLTFRHRRRDCVGLRSLGDSSRQAYGRGATPHSAKRISRHISPTESYKRCFAPYSATAAWLITGCLERFVGQIGAIMKVAEILRIKGSVVKTVPPHETALLASGHLRAEQIGALVVSTDGNSIDGIISERDLAYGLATHRERLPTIRISELMTRAVIVCSPEDSVTDVMKLMTQHRTRHVPVKDRDQLVGIISIGDVLKHRLGELQEQADVLRDYAVAARR